MDGFTGKVVHPSQLPLEAAAAVGGARNLGLHNELPRPYLRFVDHHFRPSEHQLVRS